MRRAAIVIGVGLSAVLVSAPAYAYAHMAVANPALHVLLDVLTLAVVTSPVWTSFIWSRGRRSTLLLGVIALVQLPGAVLAFTPIPNPWLHTAALFTSLAVTATSIIYVRRETAALALEQTR